MKSVIFLGDGMSDWPVEALGGKTPLMVAEKPHIDRIARNGRMGLLRTIPPGQPKGSAVANLSVLGYDPAVTFQGRAVLEAASMGVEIGSDEVALRCNLIALGEGKIKNHSAGHISSEEASQLIASLEAEFGGGRGELPLTFHPGVSYRHLLVLNRGWASPAVDCAPPHDHVGARAEELLPRETAPEGAVTARCLRELYQRVLPILARHPVNLARAEKGLDRADAIWPWSPGRRPAMQTLKQRFGISAAVISAVDLVKGLGVYAGADLIHVDGATGLSDTNYEGKAEACLAALRDHDLVYVHVEATDEAGHSRDLELKIRCIEYLDRRLVRPILEGIEREGLDVAVAVLPDHPTPVSTGSHADDPVPFAIRRPDWKPDATERYDEESAKRGSLGLLEGDGFIRLLV